MPQGSQPGAHQNNVVAERLAQYVVYGARTAIYRSRLPPLLLAYVTRHCGMMEKAVLLRRQWVEVDEARGRALNIHCTNDLRADFYDLIAKKVHVKPSETKSIKHNYMDVPPIAHVFVGYETALGCRWTCSIKSGQIVIDDLSGSALPYRQNVYIGGLACRSRGTLSWILVLYVLRVSHRRHR